MANMKHLIILILFFTPLICISQQRIQLFNQDQSIELRDSSCTSCTSYTLVSEGVNTLFKEKPQFFEMPFNIGGEDKLFRLKKDEIISKDFKIKTESGKIFDAPDMLFYRGSSSNSNLILSVNDTYINVFYSDTETTYSLIPANELTYKLQVDTLNSFSCNTPDTPGGYTVDELTIDSTMRSNSNACLKIGFEVDYDIFVEKGRNVNNVFTYVSNIFKNVRDLYDRSDIDIKISELYIWDTPSVYTDEASINVLYDFRRNKKVKNGDLFQLLSYKSSGGIAYVNVLCTGGNFNISFSSLKKSNGNPYPMYNWNTMVIAHELGHNIASKHTHACAWNGNNTAIDGCGFSTEGGCSFPSPRFPAGGGTIMSYCHLRSVGINFNRGFHPQVEALMLNKITSANCLECDTPDKPDDPKKTCELVRVELKLDNFGTEVSWSLVDNLGQVVLEGDSYRNKEAGVVDSREVCLPEGCYTVKIKDTYGDGVCCTWGNGSFKVFYKETGEFILNTSDFKSSSQTDFCITLGEDDDPNCPAINFNQYSIKPFGGTQDRGFYEIQDAGYTLHMGDNAWKSIDYDLTSDINTRIRFDYKSSKEGEIHGVGFEDDNFITSTKLMQVDGYQNWGVREYKNYPSESNSWKTYDIPIGEYIRGNFDRIIFVSDHDIRNSDGYGNAWFRNVVIYQKGECNFDDISSTINTRSSNTFNINDKKESITLFPNPTNNQITADISKINLSKNNKLEIVSISGKPITNYFVLEYSTEKLLLDVSGMLSGIYVLKISTEDKIYTKKFNVLNN